MIAIERSPGIPIPGTPYLAGGGYRGLTPELDQVVQEAAAALAEAYGAPVVIRFNSDRASGGAWLKAHEVDAIGRNSEVGINARIVCENEADLAHRNILRTQLDMPLLTRADIGRIEIRPYLRGVESGPVETVGEAARFTIEHRQEATS